MSKNPYKKMCKYKELFDLSNFHKSSIYYCDENKKNVGKMKDEYGWKSILKFVGLKSKMYSMRGIKSKNHNLGIYKTNKISLPCFDNKRYILWNGMETFAYGQTYKND